MKFIWCSSCAVRNSFYPQILFLKHFCLLPFSSRRFLLVAITQWNAQILFHLVSVRLLFMLALIHINFFKVFHHKNFMLKSSQFSLCSVMSAALLYHSISWLNMFFVWFYESLMFTTNEFYSWAIQSYNE